MYARVNRETPDVSFDYFQEHFNVASVGRLDDEAVDRGELQAMLHRRQIQQIGRALAAIGDELNERYRKSLIEKLTEAQRTKYELLLAKLEPLKNCFNKVVTVVDAVLEWLEKNCANVMETLKKQEGVLRGLTKVAELANQVGSVALVYLACNYLDSASAPFEAERQFIRNNLEAISSHQGEIIIEVDTVCSLLDEIVHIQGWDVAKADSFDNHVRKASLAISKCKNRLDETGKKISDLLFKLNAVKWFHRGLRLTGVSLSCYFLYELYAKGTITKSVALGSGAICAISWISMFPSNIYEACTDIKKLDSKHRELGLNLEDLAMSLISARKHRETVESNRN